MRKNYFVSVKLFLLRVLICKMKRLLREKVKVYR